MTHASRPLEVGVAELVRRPGSRRVVELDATLEGLELSSAAVPADVPVHVEVVLEALSEGLTATGTVRAQWVGECRRCLQAVAGDSTVAVKEVFERDPIEGETYPLGGDHVDLEPMIRDAVLLALPVAPLCSEDCGGPDPADHPVGTGDDSEPTGDPRWAALSEIQFDE